MTRTANRALMGVCALFFAVAGLDVAGAFAQALPTTDPSGAQGVTSTTCGVGTKERCGNVSIMKCSWKFEFNLNIIGKGGGLSTGEYDCQKIGSRDLYKDIDTPTNPNCTSTIGGGSRGSGSTGSRGSGDDDGYGDESCF